MTTVRSPASIPAVTCSAVVADPKPLGPGQPVINLSIPIFRYLVGGFLLSVNEGESSA